MNAKPTKILEYTLSIALAAVLLYFSFRTVKWADFLSVLRDCRWMYVALSMTVGVCAAFFRGLRWQLLIRPEDGQISSFKCFNAFNIGKIADFVVPHSGEFVRCGYIVSPRIKYDKVLGTVVLERTWDIIMLALLIVALLAVKWDMFGEFFTSRIFEPITGRVDFSLWWVLAVCVALATAAVIASGRVRGFLRGMWSGFCTCIRMRGKGFFLLYTLLMWICFYFMSWTVIQALPQDFGLDLVDALFIMLVGAVAGLVPVPGGFGAFHYILALALSSLYAIPFDMGIIFATLSHESQAIVIALCGLFSYIVETLRRAR